MPRTPTPADLTISPRNRQFGRTSAQARFWMGGDPVATAFYNALSATFPRGEAFFIDSVRAFRDGAPPRLAEAIGAFTRQEVIHSREHLAFNRRVVDAGYDVAALEERVAERIAEVRKKPPIVSLAATMALEHFTAIIAHELLADPRHLADAPDDVAGLWRWHAVEEIEHKGVAYDTWLHATCTWPRYRRWRVKAKVMLLVTRNFLVDRTRGMRDLTRQDGLGGARLWARMFWFAFVRPGMMRKVLGAWLDYFLPGFHPWRRDDRYLIRQQDQSAAGDLALA